jgi:type VI secretion system protein ImpH
MASAFGQPPAAVINNTGSPEEALASLRARPQTFSLAQAVRILYHASGYDCGIVTFIREYLRIRPHLSLGFPPSDLAALEELPPAGQGRYRLTVNMLGLYGASSPLPTFYTEDLLAEQAEDRSAARDFIDIVGDGLFGLFLWASCFRYHPLLAITEQHDQRLTEQMYALAGLRYPLGPTIPKVPLHLSGLFAQYPRSAATLRAFLEGMLEVPVRIEECVLRKVAIPQDQRALLGVGPPLGGDALLGSRADDLSGKISLWLGPLSQEEFINFSPSSPGFTELARLIDFFCSEPLSFDLHLILAADIVSSSAVLGGDKFACLNGDAWLGGAAHSRQAFFPDCPAYAVKSGRRLCNGAPL